MQEVYEYLTKIVPDFPMVHMMYLGDEDEEFIGFFEKFAKEKGYIFDVKLFGEKNDKYQSISIEEKSYHTNAYKYDIVFLNLLHVKKEHATHMLERVYASMKNAGSLVLSLENGDDFAFEAEYFLQELNFVAINPMDLCENKKIIYAKKMHGWDGAR